MNSKKCDKAICEENKPTVDISQNKEVIFEEDDFTLNLWLSNDDDEQYSKTW